MSTGVKHYKRDGTLYGGNTHRMPNGELHTGKTHGKTSVKLFHLNELSKTAKEKAMAYGGNYGNKTSSGAKKKKKKKQTTASRRTKSMGRYT